MYESKKRIADLLKLLGIYEPSDIKEIKKLCLTMSMTTYTGYNIFMNEPIPDLMELAYLVGEIVKEQTKDKGGKT